MKALILAAGKAVRLSQHLQNYQKCMVRIGDKPVAQLSFDNAVEAGVTELIVVVANETDELVGVFGDRYRDVPIRYVVQSERRGLVHAIECASATIAGDDFMLFLADEVMRKPRHREMVQAFYRDEAFVLVGIVPQPDTAQIRKTYSVLHHPGDAKVYRLVEKPRVPINQLQGTGNLVFRGAILKYLPITPVNPVRGERDLTDLVQCAIDDGRNVQWFEVGADYVNINEPDDIRKVENLYGARVSWPKPDRIDA